MRTQRIFVDLEGFRLTESGKGESHLVLHR